MPISAGVTNNWKQDILRDQANDEYKIALYTREAKLDKSLASYTPLHEVSGKGYQSGGIALRGFNVVGVGDRACVDWEDPIWPNASITARAALIYNASKGNRAVCVLDFGGDISCSNAPFAVQFPDPGATSVVRIA